MLSHYVTITQLWSIEPKIDWNPLLPTIESKNLVAIMIVSNSAYERWDGNSAMPHPPSIHTCPKMDLPWSRTDQTTACTVKAHVCHVMSGMRSSWWSGSTELSQATLNTLCRETREKCFLAALELGRFTIQIRDYDSKSHFLMSRESPIQFSIDLTHFLTQPIMFSRNLAC